MHEAVLARGCKVTGATAHLVTAGVDEGPILLQKAVEVQEGDDAPTLQRRVMEQAEWIILPQAVKVTLPAMGNEFVAIIKESSILYAVGVYELTYQAYKLASVNYYYIETMIVAALIYFVLTYVATKLLGLLERRMRRADTSAA